MRTGNRNRLAGSGAAPGATQRQGHLFPVRSAIFPFFIERILYETGCTGGGVVAPVTAPCVLLLYSFARHDFGRHRLHEFFEVEIIA